MKKNIILTESELKGLIRNILNEEIDMGQIPSAQDKEDRARSRMNFDNRPEIRAARQELRNLRHSIEDVENEGGDINPIRKKIRNINNHYFNGDYLLHLERGDKWIDYKGWFDADGNPTDTEENLEWLDESIRRAIKKTLNEVKYGGESFHGDNPVDWYAMRNLRTFSQKPLKNYDKSNRNRDNARDFFDKEFGQYKLDGDDNYYQFPNKDEYDKADKWMDDTFGKAWDKADRALGNAREVKRAEGAKLLRQLVANRETFWTKKWQQNGYYPITRWEYDEENGCYRTIWGQKVRSVDIDNVMRAATSDDLISNEPFSDEHVYEEDGIKFYPIYHADVDSALAEAVMHAIKKVYGDWD